jgi:hypothetical protein
MCKAVSKQQIIDSQLDWKEKIDKIQKPSFTGFDTQL